MGKKSGKGGPQADPSVKRQSAEIDAAICKSPAGPLNSKKKRRANKNELALAASEVKDAVQQPKQEAPYVSRGLPTPSPTPMSVGRAIPLLVCSVGNPGTHYANTLHSAGHIVLKKLSDRLGYQQWEKSRPHGNGLISRPRELNGSDWTLWQSTSLMNISGKGVKAAHNVWSQDKPDGEGKLVVVHDELEKPFGFVNLNIRQGASAKGHNGLKSILSTIGNVPFVRIGIGIGRPVSRESKDVADYVMRKTTPAQKDALDACVEEVIMKLKELEQG